MTDELTRYCPTAAAFCETCGGRDQVRGVLRDSTAGPVCIAACRGCVADTRPLTGRTAELFAAEHRRHVTRSNDEQEGTG